MTANVAKSRFDCTSYQSSRFNSRTLRIISEKLQATAKDAQFLPVSQSFANESEGNWKVLPGDNFPFPLAIEFQPCSPSKHIILSTERAIENYQLWVVFALLVKTCPRCDGEMSLQVTFSEKGTKIIGGWAQCDFCHHQITFVRQLLLLTFHNSAKFCLGRPGTEEQTEIVM